MVDCAILLVGSLARKTCKSGPSRMKTEKSEPSLARKKRVKSVTNVANSLPGPSGTGSFLVGYGPISGRKSDPNQGSRKFLIFKKSQKKLKKSHPRGVTKWLVNDIITIETRRISSLNRRLDLAVALW